MDGVCRARNCNRSKKKCPDLAFFNFPKHPISAKKWIKNIGVPELVKLSPESLKSNVLCALHFEDKCFTNKKRKSLLKNAVPTLFNITPLKGSETVQKRRVRSARGKQTATGKLHQEPIDSSADASEKLFSCSLGTVTEWQKQIDTATEHLLALVPDNARDSNTNNKLLTLCNTVDASVQCEDIFDYELDKSLEAIDENINKLSVDGTPIGPKVQLLCRFCSNLIHRDRATKIFESEMKQEKLATFLDILPLKVFEQDGLPQHICQLCVRKVSLCCDIIDTFLEADKKLRAMLSPSKSKEKTQVKEETGKRESSSRKVTNRPNSSKSSINKNIKAKKLKPRKITSSKDEKRPLKKQPNKIGHLKNSFETGDSSDIENDENYEIEWLAEEFDNSGSDIDDQTADGALGNKVADLNNSRRDKVKNTIYKKDKKSGKIKKYVTPSVRFDSSSDQNIFDKMLEEEDDDDDDDEEEENKHITSRRLSHSDIDSMKTMQPLVKLRPNKNSNSSSTPESKGSLRKKSPIRKLTCRVCKKSFSTKLKLDHHLKTHLGRNCEKCGEQFNSASDWLKHSRKHQKEVSKDVYPCETCGKEFKMRSHLAMHMKSHNSNNLLQCEFCPRTFSKKIGYRQHMRVHSSNKPLQCSECKLEFNNADDLAFHECEFIDGNHLERDFACDICGSVFYNLLDLDDHKQNHKIVNSAANALLNGLNEMPPLKGIESQINEGMMNNGGEAVAPYKSQDSINVDSIKVKVPSLEKDHIIKSVNQFVCSICDCKFSTKHFQEEHMKTHPEKISGEEIMDSEIESPEKAKLYFCDQCGEGYERKRSLALHRLSHVGSRCKNCNQVFADKSLLDSHLEGCVTVKESETSLEEASENV